MAESHGTSAFALRVAGVSKTYPGTTALQRVSFAVPRGRIHALLGGNGSGKSTLIKVLAGVVQGDPGGTIELAGAAITSDAVTPGWARAAGLSFVHQDLGLFDALSVAENLVADAQYPTSARHIRWGVLRREAQAELDRFGVPVRAEAPLASLRPVDRTLVAIVRALRRNSGDGVLVLDEPTARLPDAEVDRLLGSLSELVAQGRTVLYVSHRLDEVLRVASSVTVLRDGAHVVTRDAVGVSEGELARLIAGRAFAGVSARETARQAGEPALEVRDVAGGPLRGIDLAVAPCEVVGVAGLVGSGRSSLLETVYGVHAPRRGRVRVHGASLPAGDIAAAIAAGIAYVPEDRAGEGAFLDLGIAENLSAPDARRYRRRLGLDHRAERRDAERAIAAYGVRASGPAAPMFALSGGNQQKVAVARWLRATPRVLLLDEPTQGVDVGARADIHRHIGTAVEQGSAVLLVSSDLDELATLADRVVVIAGGRIAREISRAQLDGHVLAEQVYGASAVRSPA